VTNFKKQTELNKQAKIQKSRFSPSFSLILGLAKKPPKHWL